MENWLLQSGCLTGWKRYRWIAAESRWKKSEHSWGNRARGLVFLYGSCESYRFFTTREGGRRQKVCVQYIDAYEEGWGITARDLKALFCVHTHKNATHSHKHTQAKALITHNTQTWNTNTETHSNKTNEFWEGADYVASGNLSPHVCVSARKAQVTHHRHPARFPVQVSACTAGHISSIQVKTGRSFLKHYSNVTQTKQLTAGPWSHKSTHPTGQD